MPSPAYPTELPAQIQFISNERRQVIVQLAQQGKKAGTVLDQQNGPHKTLFERLSSLLTWLDQTVQMSPELKNETKIEDALKVILNDLFHFPETFKTKATALLEKWQTEHWGGPAPVAVDSPLAGPSEAEADDEESSTSRKKRKVSQDTPETKSAGVVMKVPYDHAIWGKHGIMHGLALKKMESGRKSKVINPEYKHLQRNAKVYGHNDITVGRWFPYQLCAVFHGAHGTSQAGITPGPVGAYSIIVSGQYEDLDRDDGEVIFYSGSGSHDNTDPGRVAAATAGTRSLHSNIDEGNPVRVLRSHSGMGRYAPSKGLRYDGLYRVVSVSTPRNLKGGLYERFRLERLEEDQIPLEQCRARPNGRDLMDYDRIEHGYPSRR
ncbi:hypothetical protein M409DRAFT_23552 [Zasmidium cellare ATCC 36951]|uniref:YDG domain-containing protein n=1 Tax=Zasmidium cellare ATCC 36951 TaxID=1080233 RepID=A0A6A6CH37_ZASCE|nr:uncharacterized protein M409DRAFT_23552 [Zasmidium cellare ATCC 36951]KAF2166361.1 hypothetical protein M409DRAFT_23552 [Zasmidium cellare ATCC 36951]